MAITDGSKPALTCADRRVIRVFVSSTFRDMIAERDELMTQTWPELRRFCRERQVELVEVDLRWGIAEEQATRKETLKLCLDEIRACRPFFIGLLGERYGWTPSADAFTADLREEQPWLSGLAGKSVTELEILHGVLNNPEMAGRAFFYFRAPAFSQARGTDFLSESAEAAGKQTALKETIRRASAEKHIPLREDYPDTVTLAKLVLEDLKAAIEAQFPIEGVPDPLTREARDHEAFAETRRRTYIGRLDYFARLDRHATDNGGPLVLVGDSGSGKSALLANWLEYWRKAHADDFIFQHYIGGTPDSADHWRLMTRLINEIKRWSNDQEDVPRGHDNLQRDFPLWLAKARSKAEHDGVRCILVLDALNQLEDKDHARLLGWLPEHPLTGGLRLVVSTLPGDAMEAVQQRGWETLRVDPLTTDERRQLIEHYLARFGKKLDAPRLDRLAAAPAAANPLFLKILLDELRVTGTHDRLDERLNDYLSAPVIPALLKKVLVRYQRDYERDRPGLVSESLGLIWAARRGLSETELLHLLKPADKEQLPLATWSPLRSALEEELVDRGGILNFAHEFLRSAVEAAFVPDEIHRNELRLQLADEFEQQTVTARNCDELPWLLWKTAQNDRLRACLLVIFRFLFIYIRDKEEMRLYWVYLGQERVMGDLYLSAFAQFSGNLEMNLTQKALSASQLGAFLLDASLYQAAESCMRFAVSKQEEATGAESRELASYLNVLARILHLTNHLAEAESLYRRALAIDEKILGPDQYPVARDLTNLTHVLFDANRVADAEQTVRRALAISERALGPDHPETIITLNNLGYIMRATGRIGEAEPMMRRVLIAGERNFGPEHPKVASALTNLASLLQATGRPSEAEPMMRRALAIDETCYGPDHPDVAVALNNLSSLLGDTKRLAEAEPLMRRALGIDEKNFGFEHIAVAAALNNLAGLLESTNRRSEAEPLYRRALEIDEKSLGPESVKVARDLNNLAYLLKGINRLSEAEPMYSRSMRILLKSTQATGHEHPQLKSACDDYEGLLMQMGQSREHIHTTMLAIVHEYFH
jgi:tetratricopeptide (TPR) repeat protein